MHIECKFSRKISIFLFQFYINNICFSLEKGGEYLPCYAKSRSVKDMSRYIFDFERNPFKNTLNVKRHEKRIGEEHSVANLYS